MKEKRQEQTQDFSLNKGQNETEKTVRRKVWGVTWELSIGGCHLPVSSDTQVQRSCGSFTCPEVQRVENSDLTA